MLHSWSLLVSRRERVPLRQGRMCPTLKGDVLLTHALNMSTQYVLLTVADNGDLLYMLHSHCC